MEIEGVTPPIINQETFDLAQERLSENRRPKRRHDREYLLSGHMVCGKCGRPFWASPGVKAKGYTEPRYPFYFCSGKLKSVTPFKCDNRQYSTNKLEPIVWVEVEKLLKQPELVFAELQRRQDEEETSIQQQELDSIAAQLKNREREKNHIHRAFYLTGDESTFKAAIAENTNSIEQLEKELVKCQERIENNKQFILNGDSLREACELVTSNLKTLDCSEKRLALQALQISVTIKDESIQIRGAVPNIYQVKNNAPHWYRYNRNSSHSKGSRALGRALPSPGVY